MAIITDSLGRRWNSALHPRDRKGRFIRTFRLVRLFDAVGGTKPWGVGRVNKINDEGHIDITVTKTKDGSKVQPGQKVTLAADKLESVNERASLAEARGAANPNSPNYVPNANVTGQNEKKGLAKQNERQKEAFGAGPQAFGMATGFDRRHGQEAERILENPEGDYDPKSKLLVGLWLDHERNAGKISDQDFVESLDDLGVDPNATDDSPDGRTGLVPLVNDYNAENPEKKAAVPGATWAEWVDADGNRTGHDADIVEGKEGKKFVKARLWNVTQNEDGSWEKTPKDPETDLPESDVPETPQYPAEGEENWPEERVNPIPGGDEDTDIPNEATQDRDVWDAIEAAELNGAPADFKDGWKVQKEEGGEDGRSEDLSFVDPDDGKHPFEAYEQGADEDGPTTEKRSSEDIEKDFEAARERYNSEQDTPPAPEDEPAPEGEQPITDALERAEPDGDPVPVREGWSVSREQSGEDGTEEAAYFIGPNGEKHRFETHDREEGSDGVTEEPRTEAELEANFQRVKGEDRTPEARLDAPTAESKIAEARALDNTADRDAWIKAQDDETLRATLLDYAKNGDGSYNDVVATAQIESALKRREAGTDEKLPDAQSKPESVADLRPALTKANEDLEDMSDEELDAEIARLEDSTSGDPSNAVPRDENEQEEELGRLNKAREVKDSRPAPTAPESSNATQGNEDLEEMTDEELDQVIDDFETSQDERRSRSDEGEYEAELNRANEAREIRDRRQREDSDLPPGISPAVAELDDEEEGPNYGLDQETADGIRAKNNIELQREVNRGSSPYERVAKAELDKRKREYEEKYGSPEINPAIVEDSGDDSSTPTIDNAVEIARERRNAPYERTEAETLEGEKFPPNPEQQEINDAIQAGHNTVVEAKAGTGKTSTLELVARRLQKNHPKKRILYSVFNSSVQAEGEERMPDNTEVRTGHSVALAVTPKWMKNRLNEGLKNNREVGEHLRMQEIGGDGLSDVARKVMSAVGEYSFSADDNIGLHHFDELDDYSDEDKNKMVAYANRAYADMTSENGKLKVTHDVYRKRWALLRPNLKESGWGAKPVDVLFIDEAQDTPPVLARVYADQMANGVQLVVVGDPDQAIYGFTGAVDFLKDIDPEMDVNLPLAKSYRYGPEIADVANRFLQMKGAPGRVVGAGGPSSLEEEMQDPKAILTRTNGGMIGHIIEQMELGKKVAVPPKAKKDLLWLIESAEKLRFGRPMKKPHDDFAGYSTWDEFTKDADSGKNPVAAKNYRIFSQIDFATLRGYVSELIEPGDGFAGNEMLENLEVTKQPAGTQANFKWGSGYNAWEEKDTFREAGFEYMQTGATYKKPYRNPKTGVQYQPGDLKPGKGFVATGTPEEQKEKVDKLLDLLSKKYGAEGYEAVIPDVTVSTAHKAKGLEWESVLIGDDFKGPKLGDDGETMIMPSEEELNLAYVAVTRAESRLDVGSLNYVFAYSDPNGGVPEAPEPDRDDLTERLNRKKEELDDKERAADWIEEHDTTPEIPATPEVPDAGEEVAEDKEGLPETYEPVDTVPNAPRIPTREDEDNPVTDPTNAYERVPLKDGYYYVPQEPDEVGTTSVVVYAPNDIPVMEVMFGENDTSTDMLSTLDGIVDNHKGFDSGIPVADEGTEIEEVDAPEPVDTDEGYPSPQPEVPEAPQEPPAPPTAPGTDGPRTKKQIVNDLDEDQYDEFDDLSKEEKATYVDRVNAGDDHQTALSKANGTYVEPEAAEQTFEERYPALTGSEDPAEVASKADELMAKVGEMQPTDPDYVPTLTKALEYTNAARGNGGISPAILAAEEEGGGRPSGSPEGLNMRPSVDESGYRIPDEVATGDYEARYDVGFIETQIPVDENGVIDTDKIQDSSGAWDFGDSGYFGRVSADEDGAVHVSIFKTNGQKEPKVIDLYSANGVGLTPMELTHTALDSIERHRATTRKMGPSKRDEAAGRRIGDAFRTGNDEGLTQDELEWKIQLEYTRRGHDGELDFDLFERLLADGKNPTLTNFLKYMEDEKGKFRFWERGEEAGAKMRIGDQAWQRFDDTEKGRAHKAGQGPPDIRHGRIVDMPDHSQPNVTIWLHDENEQPMWTTNKDGEPIPLLARYHMGRVHKYYGVDASGMPIPRDLSGRMPTDSPGSMRIGENLSKTPGVATYEVNGTRGFHIEDDTMSDAERLEAFRAETNNFSNPQHGDSYHFDTQRRVVYDSETGQYVLLNTERYQGFEESDVFTSGGATSRLEAMKNGGGYDDPEGDEFARVPDSHWKVKFANLGDFGEVITDRILDVFVYNGHEIVNEDPEASGVNVFKIVDSATRAMKRMEPDLQGMKMRFHVPKKDTDPHLGDKSRGTVLAYVNMYYPGTITVNPYTITQSYKGRNFMPVGQKGTGNLDYTLTHELGHVNDALNGDAWRIGGSLSPGYAANAAFWQKWKSQLSEYGKSNMAEGYAEAFAQWKLGGPGSHPAADAYAEFYGWTIPIGFEPELDDLLPEDIGAEEGGPEAAPGGPVV